MSIRMGDIVRIPGTRNNWEFEGYVMDIDPSDNTARVNWPNGLTSYHNVNTLDLDGSYSINNNPKFFDYLVRTSAINHHNLVVGAIVSRINTPWPEFVCGEVVKINGATMMGIVAEIKWPDGRTTEECSMDIGMIPINYHDKLEIGKVESSYNHIDPHGCHCGKEKHGFFMHTYWCPKFKEN